MDLKSIYLEEVKNSKTCHIESSHFCDKPQMYSGLISPQSTINIQPIFDVNFKIDEAGMCEILDIFQKKYETYSESDKKNMINVFREVYEATEEYFGGHGDESKRINMYLSNEILKLSDIKGERVGLCAERASVAHEIFAILQKAGILKYTSYFTGTHLSSVDNASEVAPHAVVVLQSEEDSNKVFLYDIENPILYKFPDGKEGRYIALYRMNEKQFEDFKNGKVMDLKSLLEEYDGYQLAEAKRQYGDQKREIVQESDNDGR